MFPDASLVSAAEDIPKIVALSGCEWGTVLDLCCGPGRTDRKNKRPFRAAFPGNALLSLVVLIHGDQGSMYVQRLCKVIRRWRVHRGFTCL